ncbi:hypothetical protein F4778DRAFT_198667 [Xylariomycetidae sp. FL2044]|nr:hypothetical protein F4778DRAFT_198667 [Xylariomycetidae sp. FL2044]
MSVHTPIITTEADTGYARGPDGLAPLLTVFTPPPNCSLQWFYDPSTVGTIWSNSIYDDSWHTCQPYSASTVAYGPGICPSGQEFKQVIKWSSAQSDGTTVTFYQGNCCSVDFTWVTLEATACSGCFPLTNSPTCVSTFESTVAVYVFDTETRVVAFSPIIGLTTLTTTVLTSTTTVLTTAGVAVGEYIEIYWHEDDLSSFPASLAASLRVAMGLPAYETSSTSSSGGSSSTSQTASSMTSVAARPTEQQAGLSRGAIAGISVGVAVSVLIICFLGFLALSRRWKKKKSERPGHGNQNPPVTRPEGPFFGCLSWVLRWGRSTPIRPDLPEMDQGDNVYKHFSAGAWRSELHGSHSKKNLGGDGSQNNDHPRDSRYSGSTAVSSAQQPMELEGSVPVVVRETMPKTIPETIPEHHETSSNPITTPNHESAYRV